MTEGLTTRLSTRSLLRAGIVVFVASVGFGNLSGVCAAGGLAQGQARQEQQPPAPIERRPPPSPMPSTESTVAAHFPGVQRSPMARGQRGVHIAEWMNQHSTLTPEQQQQALGREPGFQSLPQPTQQRMRDRLSQLDAMRPERRQRLLARNEAMERLSPDQRAEVRGAMGQLGSLPLDQRRVVAHTFRSLRDLPAEQRAPALSSGRFGPPLNDAQRVVLEHLMRVEPILPPPMNPVGTGPSTTR